jgi:pyruvyltransferase
MTNTPLIKTWTAPNWGDAANRPLVRFITGIEPEIIDVATIPHRTNYLVIGSILHFSDPDSVVWGAGVMDEGTDFANGMKPKSVVAVRGPKTRAHLMKHGIDCPPVYGDPALLMPRFYKPKVEKKHKVGIVRHWTDNNSCGEGYYIDVGMSVFGFIDAVCSCERILSSALHGLIVADAYGIPCEHLECGMNPFKFEDYFQSRSLVDLDRLMEACPLR